jgi:MFS family permease
MNSASPVGIFLGPLLGGPVVDAWGFPALLAINSGLMLVIIAGLSLGYRDRFAGTARGSLLRMALDSVRLIWQSPRLRALFAALFLLFAGWIMAMTYVPLVVEALYRGADPGTAVGLVLGAGGLLASVLGPWLGHLGDRHGHWRVLLTGAAVAVALWPLPALAPNLPIFGALWAVVNGLTSGLFAMSFSLVSQSAVPAVRGRVMTFAFLPTNVGSFFGPALGALITRGTIFAVFPAGAVLALLGIGLLLAARRLPAGEAGGQAAA